MEIRRDIHKHAEGAFEEVRTSGIVYDKLISFGLKEEDIRKVAVTGLEVNIKGTGSPSDDNLPSVIALRADMDAL